MCSSAPDLTDNVSYQDLGADVYEIVDASQTPVGVVSLVGESATHSRWLSLPKIGIDVRQDWGQDVLARIEVVRVNDRMLAAAGILRPVELRSRS